MDTFGPDINGLKLKIFPESSNDDKILFSEGGLTFGYKGLKYGSCDACWYQESRPWIDPFNGKKCEMRPIVALEGTDALNRGSSGNAQYQRFHHALGAVKNDLIGIYYLRKGKHLIQPDLYGMAFFASKYENGNYLIIDDLLELKQLLTVIDNEKRLNKFIELKKNSMYNIFNESFKSKYKSSWETFAKKRSSILFPDHIIKHSGRMRRNFTDGSQRAGHIAVGEMYLTKYFFFEKELYYLWPRMTKADILYLDSKKSSDKEWSLLRNEPNVKIITIDNLEGISENIKKELMSLKDTPLKGYFLRQYNKNVKIIEKEIISGKIKIIKSI